ncbi:MAG: tRNA dihydrouridine synthase DusB [Chlamydiae bacterium]|nr:tRNA dihydrouridine synthase DusB [Chlamydiota bacterium]MBI3277773.1 tRNA dihydrouridine synthase DusB [Chlamydiota bacterium]
MIQLKNLTLQSNIIQSPMAGCTDLAFRLIAREQGMEMAFLEMVSANAMVYGNPRTQDLLKRTAEDRPLGAQLVGCDPEIMGKAASMIEEMGFDLLDINCGCPVPKVTAPGGGSALLIEPEKTRKIFENVVKNIKKIPVTVKMRKGFSDPSGDEAVQLAKIAQDSGLSAVTVHGRTRMQGYSGEADWEAIGKVKRALKIPVFGNGDVTTPDDARRLLETSGCDGVMIGRGGLGNPWIYKEVASMLNNHPSPRSPTLEDKKAVALKHLKFKVAMDEERAILEFRKIATWYFRDFPGVAQFRAKVNTLKTAREMEEAIQNLKLN